MGSRGKGQLMTFDAHSLEDTAAFAAELAATLRPGDVIALDGELGAGKTTFVRALIESLGGAANAVSSPTFMLLNIYTTPRMPVFHLDAYRLGGADDLEAIGFEELLERGGLVIVEWASRVDTLLPARRVAIAIETIGENARRFSVTHCA
jgi:tRNA threonylcarbamoyladenosine biosynthesis protein TsaE